MKPVKSIDDPRFVKALSHPLRVRILAILDEGKASPNQLAGWLGASLGTVAYHVRVLGQARARDRHGRAPPRWRSAAAGRT